MNNANASRRPNSQIRWEQINGGERASKRTKKSLIECEMKLKFELANGWKKEWNWSEQTEAMKFDEAGNKQSQEWMIWNWSGK